MDKIKVSAFGSMLSLGNAERKDNENVSYELLLRQQQKQMRRIF